MVYGMQSSDTCYSVAVNVCENCGQACDKLIDLPGWNFKACATCAEEAAREDERENCEHLNVRVEEHEDPNDECVRYFEEITCRDCGEELIERKGELVARKAAKPRKPYVNCKTKPARWDSLYCSDRCKSAFLYFPEVA